MKPVKNEKEFQRPEFIETFSSKSTKRVCGVWVIV